MPSRSRVLIVVLMAVLMVGRQTRADKDKAREAYRLGMQHYNLAEYKEALESFKQAYREFEEPSFLFNIGQCHRQLDDKPMAVKFFKAWLREVADAPNREEVKHVVSTLEQEIATEQANKSGPPQGTIPPEPPAKSPAGPPEVAPPAPRPITPLAPTLAAPAPNADKPLSKKPWFWATVVGAVVVAAVGVGLGIGLGNTTRDPVPSIGTITKN